MWKENLCLWKFVKDTVTGFGHVCSSSARPGRGQECLHSGAAGGAASRDTSLPLRVPGQPCTSQAPHSHPSTAVVLAAYKIAKNEYSKPNHCGSYRKVMFPKWSKWIYSFHQSFNKMEFFSLKQYRAYDGAFKAVPEKNGASEETKDLQALRFLSVISIVDPWIFIIFRTSVFRMFFHKIFIRPLMYRNWHNNSCQTNMESSLWQCFTLW